MEIIQKNDAIKQGLKHYFTGEPCKRGHVSERFVSDRRCMKCSCEDVKRRHLANYEKYREYGREYQKNNRGKMNAQTVKRREILRKRLPKWANIENIRHIYEEAVRKSKETGLEYQVDHIVPLCGKTVSGLHVFENLQIILAKENRSKSNSYK
jgi:uncharacterized protein YqeY